MKRLKESGKWKKKNDCFSLDHYRTLFLILDNGNSKKMNENEIKLHEKIFDRQFKKSKNKQVVYNE